MFLLFKLMFLSGVTKILSGDPTWRQGTALDFHFETQPLPPWTAWYAHHWPAWIHHVLTWGTLAVELARPGCCCCPTRFHRPRLAGVLAIALLQVGIAATGNYGFFNLLTLVLCLPALSDAPTVWEDPGDRASPRKALPVGPDRGAGPARAQCVEPGPGGRLHAADGRGAGWWPGWGDEVMGWVEPFRSVNGYGLFRVMTTERPELVLEGSRDGAHWEAYGFRYKPGDPMRRPGFVAPFHPRLDWQLWFAALGPGSNLGWLGAWPRGCVRARRKWWRLWDMIHSRASHRSTSARSLYDYRFSTPEQRRRTGAWWVRTLEGTFVLAPERHGSPGP